MTGAYAGAYAGPGYTCALAGAAERNTDAVIAEAATTPRRRLNIFVLNLMYGYCAVPETSVPANPISA